jgi:hypothetical protein
MAREPTETEVLDMVTRFLSVWLEEPPAYADIYASFIAWVVTRHQNRRVHGSDLQDLSAASLAIPYSHIFTCDAFTQDVLRSIGVDAKYECPIYSPREAEVNALAQELDSLI